MAFFLDMGYNPRPKEMSCKKHKWAPYQQWLGRYVCEECKGIGYVTNSDFPWIGLRSTHGGHVVLYRCSKEECNGLVTSMMGDMALCEEHIDNIKISSAERKYHESVEKQNTKDQDMIEDAFRRMTEATKEALPKRKKDD